MRRTGITILGLLLLASVTLAPGAETGDGDGYARVTYISGSSVYVGAGRKQGLQEGDELPIVRDGEVVSRVRVEVLSSLRASCTVVDGYPVPELEDLVRLPFADHVDTPEPTPPGTIDPGPNTGTNFGDARALAFARVSHVDQERVFIDAGQDENLRGGDRLPVLRGGDPVAMLEVTDVSADRSACKIVDGLAHLEPGEIVRLPIRDAGSEARQYRSSVEATSEVRAVAKKDPRKRGRGSAGFRGRVGIRYLSVQDGNNASGDFSQPALDLRLDGSNLAGKHLDGAIDVRSRRTYRNQVDASGEVTAQTRVYRASATIHDQDSHYRLTIGRQYSPSLASVSTFDGVLLDFNGDRWSTGLFGGTQPAVEDYGYSSDISEYGIFVQAHNRRARIRPWSLTLGAIGSYQLGSVNREFAYIQTLYTGRRLTFYASEEVDYNRDWKQELGEKRISPTSSYVHLSYRVGGGFTWRTGYDNRRNVRLYRDFINVAVEFDDTFRRGAWVGFTQRIKKRFRFGLDAKNSRSEKSGNADTYTFTAGTSGLSKANFSSHYRGSHYSNETVEGWLHSLNTSVSMTRHARLSATYGLREDSNLVDPTLDNRLVWYGLETDFNIGRHWFVQLSSERTTGDNVENDQSYLSMTYRF